MNVVMISQNTHLGYITEHWCAHVDLVRYVAVVALDVSGNWLFIDVMHAV